MNNDPTSLLALKRTIAILQRALLHAGENFQLAEVSRIDKQVAALLNRLKHRPELRSKVITELNGLALCHRNLLQQCSDQSNQLKHKIEFINQNREGLIAYQEIEGQIGC